MIKVKCLKPLSTTPTSPPIRILGSSVHERPKKRVVAVAKPPCEYPADTVDGVGALAREEAEVIMEATARTVVADGGDCADIAAALNSVGFAATVCVSAPAGSYAVSHSHVRASHGNAIYAIDHEFGDQFALPFGSPEYVRVVDSIPDIVVAKLDRVIGAVGQLTQMMIREFEAKDISLPPWRRPNAMLHRWCPNRPYAPIPHPS